MDSLYCTAYCVQCTVYSVHCTLYTVQFTLYSVQCTVYSTQCTVYSLQCTVYTVHCTIYHGGKGPWLWGPVTIIPPVTMLWHPSYRQGDLNGVQCTVYTLKRILLTVHWTTHWFCTLDTPHFTLILYLHTAHLTLILYLHTAHFIPTPASTLHDHTIKARDLWHPVYCGQGQDNM